MAKVGRFVVDPRAGSYCQITLDSGEKIVINHDKGGFKGGHLTIEVPKFLGLSSDRIFACDLDSEHGKGRAHSAHTRRPAGQCGGDAPGSLRGVRQGVPLGGRGQDRVRGAGDDPMTARRR